MNIKERNACTCDNRISESKEADASHDEYLQIIKDTNIRLKSDDHITIVTEMQHYGFHLKDPILDDTDEWGQFFFDSEVKERQECRLCQESKNDKQSESMDSI